MALHTGLILMYIDGLTAVAGVLTGNVSIICNRSKEQNNRSLLLKYNGLQPFFIVSLFTLPAWVRSLAKV